MRRRSVTTVALSSGDDKQCQHSVTVVENIRLRQQMDGDGRWAETSVQLAKSNQRRWSDIWGAWTGNGREERKESDAHNAEELIAALKSLHCSGKLAAKSAEAQMKGANALAKWASKSKNEAMSDIVGRVSELLEMHADKQHTFAKDYGHYLRQLQKVAETERKIRAQRRKVEKLTEQERRIGKMLAKKGDGAVELSAKLDKAKQDREWAERETEERREENEFARMAHLEAALKGMADVQLNLARAGQLIFTCQSELTGFMAKELNPTEEMDQQQQQRYERVSQTRQKMSELRRSLETGEAKLAYNAPSSVERRHRQRRSEPSSLVANTRLFNRLTRTTNGTGGAPFGTPPPPYTPSAPPLDLLDNGTRSPITSRHSVGPSLFREGNGDYRNAGGPSPAEVGETVVPRIYPQLPPNPFAEELKLRRRCREKATISAK